MAYRVLVCIELIGIKEKGESYTFKIKFTIHKTLSAKFILHCSLTRFKKSLHLFVYLLNIKVCILLFIYIFVTNSNVVLYRLNLLYKEYPIRKAGLLKMR